MTTTLVSTAPGAAQVGVPGQYLGHFEHLPCEIARNQTKHNALEKGYAPYYTVLAPMYFDWTQRSCEELERFLNLFKEQAFQKSTAANRTEVVILLNRSSKETKNVERKPIDQEACKNKISAMIQEFFFKIRILDATWKPGPEVKEGERASPPYASIREALLKDHGVEKRVTTLQGKRGSTHYLVGMDADARRLDDGQNRGLFSYLDLNIKWQDKPGAVVFGYALDAKSPLTKLACKIDMSIRQILFRYDFTPYLPEPMTALSAKFYEHYSYLKDPHNGNEQGGESLNLVRNLREKLNRKFRVYFRSIDVVTTTQPSRMHAEVPARTALELTQEKLDLVRNLAQSHFKHQVARKRIYESLPKRCTRYEVFWTRSALKDDRKAFLGPDGSKIPTGRAGLKEIFDEYKNQKHRLHNCRDRLEILLDRYDILPSMRKPFSQCSVDEILDKIYSIEFKEQYLQRQFSSSRYTFRWLKDDPSRDPSTLPFDLYGKTIPIGREGLREIFKNFRNQREGRYDPLYQLLKIYGFFFKDTPAYDLDVDQIIEKLYQKPNFEKILEKRLKNFRYKLAWVEASAPTNPPLYDETGKKIPTGRGQEGLREIFNTFRKQKKGTFDPLETLLKAYDIKIDMGKPLARCTVDEIIERLYSDRYLEERLERTFHQKRVIHQIDRMLKVYDILGHLGKLLKGKNKLSLQELEAASKGKHQINRRVFHNRGNYKKNVLTAAEEKERGTLLHQVKEARNALADLGWQKSDREAVECVAFDTCTIVSKMLIQELSATAPAAIT